MSEVSEYEGISSEDVESIKAIIATFYGDNIAARFTSSSITNDTLNKVAYLLVETVNCSQWMDAVPNPSDILMPSKNLRKWALRLIRNAGKPFIMGNAKVTAACRNFRAAQLKPEILMSLNF